MMEEKYYTPEIEEFGIGFEFEISVYKATPEQKETQWAKCVVHPGMEIGSFFNVTIEDGKPTYSMPDCIRVKCLDKDDIESLGWVFDPDKSSTTSLTFNKGDATLVWHSNLNAVGIFTTQEDDHTTCMKIKNKYELKKLLTQKL